MSLQVTAIFSNVQKDEEKKMKKAQKFAQSYLGNGLRDLQIWYCGFSVCSNIAH